MKYLLTLVLFLFSSVSYSAINEDWMGINIRAHGFLTFGGSWITQDDRSLVGGSGGLDDYLDEFSLKWPSTLGAHTIITYKDLSFVSQVVTMGRQDWNVDVEWAYLSYNLTDNLSVRAGRMIDPYLMLSQIRHVGLAYPWPLPLFDLYGLAGQVKGVDFVYKTPLYDWDIVFNPYYLEDANENKPQYQKQGGFQLSLLKDDTIEFWFTLHQNRFNTDQVIDYFDNVLAPYFLSVGYPQNIVDDAINELKSEEYFYEDYKFNRWAVGWRYEDNDIYFMGHLSKHMPQRYQLDMLVWYVVLGYNFTPKLMPYIEYGYSKQTGDWTPYRATLSGGYGESLQDSLNANQDFTNEYARLHLEVSAIGVRYAMEPGTDLKVEWRRFNPRNGTSNFIIRPFDDNHTDMVTIAVNAVF